MSPKEKKTNAMRICDQQGIFYRTGFYAIRPNEHLDGVEVARQIGLPANQVFKTLVTTTETDIVVCMVPVSDELSLKSLAVAAGKKKLELLPLKDLTKITGYVRGGCSPIGMKKKFPTYLDSSALMHNFIAISAGVKGQQIFLHPQDLITLTNAITGVFTA